MRIAYLECFSGISGDMFLGALVDAGISPKLLQDAVAALNIGARLEISRVVRSGVTASKADVWVQGEKDLPREEYWRGRSEPYHSHEHRHSESGHAQPGSGEALGHQPHSHAHPASERSHADHHGRGLAEIRGIITRAAILEPAKQKAISIFEALGRAEAKIHNLPIEKVHFHEVGAVDAMVDIVCAAVGAEALCADEIVCSPLNVGGGAVVCAHGTFPVPAPATLELLANAPVYSSGLQAELVTPTGAAIVKTLVSRFGAFPGMKVDKSGYGAGSRDFEAYPNVLRLSIGEANAEWSRGPEPASVNRSNETITVLEATLDDLNPQVFGYVMDRLLEEKALDVFATPVQMKKNRPGTLLTVLCRPENAEKVTELLFAETTTLGVRRREEARQTLARRWESVQTRWGDVRVKIASLNGAVTNYAPEYEDCRRIAAEQHIPLKRVLHEATRVYLSNGKGQ